MRLARDSVVLATFGPIALGISIPVNALSFPGDAGLSVHLVSQGHYRLWLPLWEALVNLL